MENQVSGPEGREVGCSALFQLRAGRVMGGWPASGFWLRMTFLGASLSGERWIQNLIRVLGDDRCGQPPAQGVLAGDMGMSGLQPPSHHQVPWPCS